MKRAPKPRKQIYDLYWYFASERQQIYLKRLSGTPGPWTADPILRKYKFCNVFRVADRVSQYMVRNVCFHDEPCKDEDRLFQIVAFRFFSNIQTWDAIHRYLGHYPLLDDLANGSFRAAIEYAEASHGNLYTGAFILCAGNPYGQPRKYLNHIELFKHMFLIDRLADKLLTAQSLGDVFISLRKYPLMGDFMSYQTAIDMNYSSLINFDENEFVVPGPGALRGIKKVFEDLGDYTPAEAIHWMVQHQDQAFASAGLPPATLFGRKLHAIDCQGLFCETDKYCREAAPELASTRKRIKTKFHASPAPMTYFFPPKWHIHPNGNNS